MNKDAYYFPHFCTARHDRKIKRLRKELGVEGYGIYFMVLEVLREQLDYKYPTEDIDLLADEFGTSEQKVRTVICNYKLFEIDLNDNFFSPKQIEFLQPYINMKNQRIEAGKKSAEKRRLKKLESNDNSTTVERESNDRLTTVEQSKVKKSKVKKSKVNDIEKNTLSSSEKKVINFYNKNIGLIPPTIYQQIESYLEDGIEPEMIIKCLEIAVEQNVPKWSYAKSILEDKFKKNIKTLYDFEASEIQHKQKEAPTEPVEEFVLTDEMLNGSIFDIK